MEARIPEGFKVGHYNDDCTGVSVILAEGAVGGVDVRGCAPGTRESDLLRSEKAIEEVHAVALCGGSSYGLEACCGIMNWLKEQGIGYRMGELIVPLVAGAVIFDLKDSSYRHPDAEAGRKACENASNLNLARGKVGAGKGATVGKIRGDKFSDEGGLGIATVMAGAATVTAVVVVNACGDVYDLDSGKIIAGAKANDGSFLDTAGCIVRGDYGRLMTGGNTTIGCIMTDAKLTKLQANKIASLGHDGMARAIRPVHTDFDGDTLFALASGKVDAQFMMVGAAAEEAVARAIMNAVKRG